MKVDMDAIKQQLRDYAIGANSTITLTREDAYFILRNLKE